MSEGSSSGPAPDPSVYFGEPIVPVATVTIVLSTFFVGLRFWSRAAILRAVALEDAFMFLGWVSHVLRGFYTLRHGSRLTLPLVLYSCSRLALRLSISLVGVSYFQAVVSGKLTVENVALKYGLGRQYAALDSETLTNNLKVSPFSGINPEAVCKTVTDRPSQTGFATQVIYAFALLFVKISILCLYIRVLTYDYARLAAKIMLAVVGITHAWILISIFTGCVPLAGLWDVTTHLTAYCHPASVYWSHSGINIGTDFLIFLLPLTVLRKLYIPRRQKIALYCVFLVAFLYVGSLISRCPASDDFVDTLQRLHHLPRADSPVCPRHDHRPGRRHDQGRRHHRRLDHGRGQHGRHLRLSHHHQACTVSILSPLSLANPRVDG